MCVIVHNEVYRLPVANYPDEVLSNCITEIFEYFYEEGFGGVEQSDFRVCRRKPIWQTNLFLVLAR